MRTCSRCNRSSPRDAPGSLAWPNREEERIMAIHPCGSPSIFVSLHGRIWNDLAGGRQGKNHYWRLSLLTTRHDDKSRSGGEQWQAEGERGWVKQRSNCGEKMDVGGRCELLWWEGWKDKNLSGIFLYSLTEPLTPWQLSNWMDLALTDKMQNLCRKTQNLCELENRDTKLPGRFGTWSFSPDFYLGHGHLASAARFQTNNT